MNMHTGRAPEEAPDADLLGYLSGLPAPAATPALWARIDGTQTRRRRRRQLLGAGGAVSAVAVLAMVAVHIGRSAVDAPIVFEANVPLAAPLDVRQIDRQLQAAYDDAADPEQINALWQARALATTPIEQENQRHEALIRL